MGILQVQKPKEYTGCLSTVCAVVQPKRACLEWLSARGLLRYVFGGRIEDSPVFHHGISRFLWCIFRGVFISLNTVRAAGLLQTLA